MSNSVFPFDNDEIVKSDTVTDCFSSIKKDEEEQYEAEGISPLSNYYVSPGKKKISKDLEKIDDIDAKRFIKVKNILTEAQTSYTLDYVKQLIELGRYYGKELLDFELSKEKENIYLENIRDLESNKYGVDSSKMEEIVNTVKYVNELEKRLEKKGLIRKKTTKEIVVNRIARKESDSI